LPFALASICPAFVFSNSISLSYSANEANMDRISLPAGVLVSMPTSKALKTIFLSAKLGYR
jgi:hypothetical protein